MGYQVSGKASEVDAYCAGKKVLGEELLGGFKSACLLGQPENVPVSLEMTALDLQKLFVQLTNAKGRAKKMKIGKMFRWYWQNTYWGLVGFYGAMLFLMLLGFVIMAFSSTEEVSVNGFAFSAEIMLLVMGIIFFPAGTRFGLSNGVSRKTVFCGMVLFLLALSVGMTLVNLLGQWAGSAMGLNTDAVEKMVYPSLTGLGGHFGVIVSQIAGGWALGMLGYFIGGAYYRMNKIWKIVVSITVPALLVFGLPLLLVAAPAGVVETLGNWFFSAIEWVVRSSL